MTSSRASERQIEEHVHRHAGILSNAEATILVTVPEARGVARLLEARVAGLRRVVTVAELKESGGEPLPVPSDRRTSHSSLCRLRGVPPRWVQLRNQCEFSDPHQPITCRPASATSRHRP